MVVKFDTNASGAMWLPNLVMESISGSVVPLAIFLKQIFNRDIVSMSTQHTSKPQS